MHGPSPRGPDRRSAVHVPQDPGFRSRLDQDNDGVGCEEPKAVNARMDEIGVARRTTPATVLCRLRCPGGRGVGKDRVSGMSVIRTALQARAATSPGQLLTELERPDGEPSSAGPFVPFVCAGRLAS
ncbi:MAG: excalibur calcium-binding domain-containing protein [Chloroflexi bacterium]|nr:excalibur calcium-binding domain-containing protein [Chloroflexota bacterium]